MLKLSIGIIAVTLILSLGVYLFFYIWFPDLPLDAQDMAVVVGACLMIVLFAKWMWGLFRKK